MHSFWFDCQEKVIVIVDGRSDHRGPFTEARCSVSVSERLGRKESTVRVYDTYRTVVHVRSSFLRYIVLLQGQVRYVRSARVKFIGDTPTASGDYAVILRS